MNTTLKNTLMALATAALGLGAISGCSSSAEEPEGEASAGGESTEVPAGDVTGGEAACSGEGHCGAEKHGGEAVPEGELPPEGEAPPSP